MRVVMFYHSLVSDWNHGNAHFLRGIVSELMRRGHEVEVYEPRAGWSLDNLISERGRGPLFEFQRAYRGLQSHFYDLAALDLDSVLDGADLVLVHEWNDPELVSRLAWHHTLGHGSRDHSYRLLFHDTHHRSVTDPESLPTGALSHFDGVLAFGNVIRDRYLEQRWTDRAWTWHEAADTRVFHPIHYARQQGDLVWIGNWGDEERSAELAEFLLGPVRELKLRARVHGVRYPQSALQALQEAGIEYAGWLPNYKVPEIFARFRLTVHIPRQPYVTALPGIPTIRVFEAMACGIPLICSPWEDSEHLFTPGEDFLIAQDGAEMTALVKDLLRDPEAARRLADHALDTILSRHTCAHRVDKLLDICDELEIPRTGSKLELRLPVSSRERV